MTRLFDYRGKLLRLLLTVVTLVAQMVPAAIISQPVQAQTAPAAPPFSLPPATTVNNPPVAPLQILVFPQRDFVSASGYTADDQVIVTVQHPNGTVWTTDPNAPIIPQADPRAAPGAPFAGIVEVNHPGGACWFNTTPDIAPGDKVRITIVANPVDATRVGRADETTVANVTATRPVETNATTVQIHGTATTAAGGPIDIAALEQRLVANKDIFLFNGRRTLRATAAAGADGTLAYDPVSAANPAGTRWTATYTGLQAADVTRALGAESRILWNGTVPAALVEGTIYEIGAGVLPSPAAPCTAPLEKLPPPPGSDVTPPTAPSGLAATVANANTVNLSWTAATDNVGVTSYGVYRDGLPIFNVENPDGSAPAPTTYVDANVPPGTYTYTVDAADAIGNRSALSNAVTVTTAANLAALPAGTVVNDPPAAPVQLISFPSRDFVSNSGFLATDTVQVQVLRQNDPAGGLVVVSTSTVIPQADPRAAPGAPFAGIVEVNHPGGGCWDGVTPDIRPGDIIRTIAYNPDGTIRTVDQTHTANAIAQRPKLVKNASSSTAADGVVEVHGMAMYPDGSPIDLAQFENRLIANRDLFVLNGRRTIRAGGAGKDGAISYDATDPTGTHWTATYTGLVQQDVDRIMGTNGFHGAESRAIWLGSQPLADGVVNGPSAAVCFAPSEPFDTTPPLAPTVAASQAGPNSVLLNWGGASDNVAIFGYGLYQDGIRIRNVGRVTTFTLNNVPAGNHTYQVDAMDSATPAAQIAAVPSYNSEYGNRSALSNVATLAQPDVIAPSTPTNLVAVAAPSAVNLSWTASTDNIGVTSYGVYRGGVKLADVPAPGTSYSDSGLAVGTYTYTVDAADAAGNRSAQTAAVTANVTANADAIAPTVPTNLVADTRDIYTGALAPAIGPHDVKLTWTASTDNVGVTSYGVWRRNTIPAAGTFAKVIEIPAAAAPSYVDTTASIGTYDYAIDAVDSAGNRSALSAFKTAVTVNDPPTGTHSILPFPQRDFVSSTGYALSEGPVTVTVIRGGRTVATSTAVTPVEDPATPGLGAAEVNHPGGGCWSDVTPNILPGDIVRYTNAAGQAEQTRTRFVTAYRAVMVRAADFGLANGIVEAHGRALNFDGTPMAAAEANAQVESRLVANRDLFEFNGRRVMRAGGAGTDGTFSYDAVTGNWTATYSNLSANDVARAVGGPVINGDGTVPPFPGAESRALHIGLPVAAAPELTIYEDSDGVLGGPVAGGTGTCTSAPQEPAGLTTLAPASLTFSQNVGTTSSQTVTLTNSGTAPLKVSGAALSGVYPGDYAIASNTCLTTLAIGASCTATVSFTPKALGTRNAALEFQSNAGDTPGVVPLNGTAANVPAPVVSLSPTSLAFAGTVVGSTSAAQAVTLSNTGNAALSLSSVTVTGPFAITTNSCGTSVAAGASCSVSVVFKPTAVGAASGSLSFADNAAGSPQSVALSGSGTAQPVTAPSTPVLDPASDSGVKGDKITNVTTPTFTGTAPTGTTVSILSDGVSVGSAATSATGTYSVTTSLLADGKHVITAQAKDAAGTLSPASAGLTVTIDTVAPVATAPQASMAAGTKVTINPTDFPNSTIPVTLTWSATDANGVASYQLQKKQDTLVGTATNAGAFTDVAPAPTSTSATLDLSLGQMLVGKPIILFNYTFQVKACDVAGNCGTFAAAPKFQMIPVDDTLTGPLLNGAGSVGYSGSWSTGAVTGAYNNSVHFTTAVGANARLNNVTFTVSGNVVWVSTKGPDRGIATVTVDGVSQSVDLYAPTAQPAQVVFATNGLASSTQHQVTVTSTGTKNAASTGVRIDLDGFIAVH